MATDAPSYTNNNKREEGAEAQNRTNSSPYNKTTTQETPGKIKQHSKIQTKTEQKPETPG